MARQTDAEIEAALADLLDWRREGDELVLELELRDFVEALGLMTQIGVLAERANHHPHLTNVYNRLRIALTTHDEGGITEHDIALAREITERVS